MHRALRAEIRPEIGALASCWSCGEPHVLCWWLSWRCVAARLVRPASSPLEKFAREHGEHNATPRGERQLATLTPQGLEKILGKMNPHPRRSPLKALRHFGQWAKAERLVQHDLTAGMKLGRVPKTVAIIQVRARYREIEAAHPIGSKERLALAIMLYTGLRRSDAIRFGPQHVHDGMIEFVPQKTESSTGFTLRCRIHPELAKVIAGTSLIGAASLLVSERGKSFGPSGFSGFMRAACNKAGLPECSSHGLRKACARRLADAGADVLVIASITGHADLRELQVYIRNRDQRLAAERAVAAMPGGSAQTANTNCQTKRPGLANRPKIVTILRRKSCADSPRW